KAKAQSFAAHPLAQLAAASALGIRGAHFLAVPLLLLISLAALTTILALTALLRRWMKLATLLVTVATMFLGASLAAIEKNEVPANQLKRLIGEETIAMGEPVELTGVLERDPEVAPERMYLFVQVQKIRFKQTERDVSGEVVLLAQITPRRTAGDGDRDPKGESTQEEYDQLDLRY